MGAIVFFAVCIAIIAIGWAICERIWIHSVGNDALQQTTPLERLTAAAVAGAMLWLGVNWLLALTHTLTRASLLIAAVACMIAALILIRRNFALPRAGVFALIVCLPIVLWIAYVLWRGFVLPPDNHDALAYHFPKAVFMAQTHGYGYLVTADPRVTVLPANYELLLTDILVLTGTDHITEWLGTVFYILFLIASAAAIERWFGRGLHVVASVIAIAATPVLLLHSGADKNDLMTCFFAIAALLWGARWYVHGGTMPWILTIVSLVLAGGTKPHAAAVLLGLAPFMITRAVRKHVRWREVAATIAFALIAFAIGGGAVYAVNFAHARDKATAIGSTPNFIGYGDFANLWRFPYLALAEPFSRNAAFVWVPWRHEYWFWPRYEIFFSGFGPLFTVLICLIPYALYRFRDRIEERFVFSVAALIAAFLIMPLQFRPVGFFGGLPRFIAFIIPAVMGYSVAPTVARARAMGARLMTVALSLYFCAMALQCAYYDRYSPFKYARLAATRHIRWTWTSRWRASNVLDQVAGPNDVVAIDSGFDTWVYPAMGEWHSRRVEFIEPGSANIPAEAQWVMVDRWWNTVWGNPAMTNLGRVRNPLPVLPNPDDTRVTRALLHDSRFVVVYYEPKFNQAVFRRR